MIRLLLIICLSSGMVTGQDTEVDAINRELDDLRIELTDSIPGQRPAKQVGTLPMTGDRFYDVEENVKSLQEQIDSLKLLLKIYAKKADVPPISKELLELASSKGINHRITLQNGTVVLGRIMSETDQQLVLQTSIGKLVISRDKVEKIDEYYPDSPQVDLVGEPQVKVYPDMEVITGKVKNNGTLRADFVRVVANLWSGSTELAFQDSAFVNGEKIKYGSGVFSDTALEPGSTATFRLIVKFDENAADRVSYRTFDTRWNVVK